MSVRGVLWMEKEIGKGQRWRGMAGRECNQCNSRILEAGGMPKMMLSVCRPLIGEDITRPLFEGAALIRND